VRYARNPVVQFLAAGLLVLVVVVVGTVQLSRHAADKEAVDDARATTEILASSVAQPALPPGLAQGRPGAVDRFDRTALRRLLVGDVQRIKIWTPEGRIVYSDETRLIGDRFPLGPEELEVLREGSSDAEISDLSEPENRFEPQGRSLLEVYTRVWSPEHTPLLFEAYYSATDVARRRQQVYDSFQPITLGGLLVLVAVTTPLLWVLTRRLERTGRDRTRLLQAAADASESERRRIARDLHDGVVQELAGTSFALSATVRDPATDPATARRLEPMAGALRSNLRSLRSLLVEIYPPDLRADGLEAALGDLVAPAAAHGVHPVVEVYDVTDAPEEAVRLVWRVAQEAVRNTLRHAHATTLTIQVGRSGERLTLDVTDDGIGFEGGASGSGLGLRGLRDLVAEVGGRLDVRSAPGGGTTVHLEVT
jgi:two-component system, NarL family, sensor kinase